MKTIIVGASMLVGLAACAAPGVEGSEVLGETSAAVSGGTTYQFKFPWTFSPGVWIAGVAVGALCAVAGGWFGLRNVLRQPPLQTLREA